MALTAQRPIGRKRCADNVLSFLEKSVSTAAQLLPSRAEGCGWMDLESFFTPYASVKTFDVRNAAVLAPHCDDEVFGCGGTLAALAEQGVRIHVAVASGPDDMDERIERRDESIRASRILGYPPPRFFGFRDGLLLESTSLKAALRRWLEHCQPDILFVPSLWEMHRDHRACAEAALQVVMERRRPLRVAMYEVGVPLDPTVLFDISPWLAKKRRASTCFRTQLARQPYHEQIEGLNRFRSYTLEPGVKAAEAFCVVETHDLILLMATGKPQRSTMALLSAQRHIRAVREEAVLLYDNLVQSQKWSEKLEADLSELRRQLQESHARIQEVAKDGEERVAAALKQGEERVIALQSVMQSRIDELEGQLRDVLNSRSWRYTEPLRNTARSLRSLRWRLPALRQKIRSLFVRVPLTRTWASFAQRTLDTVRSRLTGLFDSPNNARCAATLLAHREEWLRDPPLPAPYTCRALADEPPPIDLSLVTFNSAVWLPGFLESLSTQQYPLSKIRLLVVDNGSRDDTVGLLRQFRKQNGQAFLDFQIHEAPNVGFGVGHNTAIAHGNAPFILVSNPDLRFTPDAISRVVGVAVQDDPRTAAWELRQLPYEHPKHYDPVTWETAWCSHACILLRRRAFEDVGGYDRRIFLYGEDVELSYRLRAHGHRLRYCPIARVFHYAYSEPGAIKPAQYTGSITANFFVRTRYGTLRDAAAVFFMAVGPFLQSPFPRSRRILAKKIVTDWLRHAPSLLLARFGDSHRGIFPFRGFDYERRREGAFCDLHLADHENGFPLVSIITRTMAGRRLLLLQTAYSVFHQTYPRIEWILVEDGGTSHRDLVDELSERSPFPVRYVPLPKVGRAEAGNAGLRAAKGEFFLFLDDDDLLYADHVETLVKALLSDDRAAAAYALSWEVPASGGLNGPLTEGEYVQRDKHRQPFDPHLLQEYNYIPIQAILCRRRLFEERGGFDTGIDYLEDWNLWQRYAHGNTFVYVEKTTSLYRVPKDPRVLEERQKKLDAAYFPVRERTQRTLADLERERSSEGGRW